MKVVYGKSFGCIHGQFNLTAESEADRMFLHMFVGADREKWVAAVLNWNIDVDSDSVTGMAFGYQARRLDSPDTPQSPPAV